MKKIIPLYEDFLSEGIVLDSEAEEILNKVKPIKKFDLANSEHKLWNYIFSQLNDQSKEMKDAILRFLALDKKNKDKVINNLMSSLK